MLYVGFGTQTTRFCRKTPHCAALGKTCRVHASDASSYFAMKPAPISRSTFGIVIAINSLAYLYQSLLRPHALDYGSLYAAGVTARIAPRMLYDWNFQVAIQRQLLRDTAFFPYYHPPLEIPVLALLSKLPFAYSLGLWRLLSIALLLVSGRLLAKALGQNPIHATLLGCAIYSSAYCVSLGQDSIALLLIICGAFYFLTNDAEVLSGVVLSLALFKPQLPVILAFALFALGRKRFIWSFMSSALVVTCASLLYMGKSGAVSFLECMRLGEQHAELRAMPNILGVLSVFGGDHARLAIAFLLIGLALLFPVWKKSKSLGFTVASSICFASIAAPHLFAYDLVVLVIPLAILFETRRESDTLFLAVITSAPLALCLFSFRLSAFLVIPTGLLFIACFSRLLDSGCISVPLATQTARLVKKGRIAQLWGKL